MPAYIDFTGRKIGRVKILESVQRGVQSRWKCLCDCGKEFICLHKSFKRGDTFECDACRYERRRGIDLTGRKFGRWTVIERQLNQENKTVWYVKCDCGNFGHVSPYALGRRGKSMSCGCLGRKEKSIHANETLYPPKHLTSTTYIYAIRERILQGCYNEKSVSYKNYGAKGITVCELWRNGAKEFRDWCLAHGWQRDYVVHLQHGTYQFNPENCIILTPQESTRLQLAKKITIQGKELTVFEWSEISGLSHHTILDRLKKGYSKEEAVFAKRNKHSGKRRDYPDEEIKRLYESGLSLADVGRQLGENYSAVSSRLRLMGVEVDTSAARRKFPNQVCMICNVEFESKASKQKYCKGCKNLSRTNAYKNRNQVVA